MATQRDARNKRNEKLRNKAKSIKIVAGDVYQLERKTFLPDIGSVKTEFVTLEILSDPHQGMVVVDRNGDTKDMSLSSVQINIMTYKAKKRA